MNKHRKPESFLKKPWYQGGNDAFRKFLVENLKYPQEAAEHQIAGIVKVRIDIDRKGNVTKANILKGLGHGCDEEAVRIAKLLKWLVQPPKSGHIIFHKTIDIPFKLPPKSAKSMPQQFNYNIKPKQANPQSQEQPKSKLGYTIKLNS